MNLKNRLVCIICLSIVFGVDLGTAKAQSPFTPFTPYSGVGGLPQNRPVFSPYLNLLRRGNSPALNYYGLVRPELNAINNFNAVQNQFNNQNQIINDAISGDLPDTGRVGTFLNLGGYFGNNQGSGRGAYSQVGGLGGVGNSLPNAFQNNSFANSNAFINSSSFGRFGGGGLGGGRIGGFRR